ncbi:MAG: hypothetical protein ACJ8OJ_02790 [Povalibacter sp.]
MSGLSNASIASAPTSALGDDLPAAEGFWMHAEPVHLVAGMDRLTFVPLQSHAPLSSDERSAIGQTLAAQFPHQGLTWHSTATHWFIRSDRLLDATTSTPDAAGAHELRDVLPQGKEGPYLRKLMTELQMALHDHPVNAARERRGEPTVNAIWLWGAGSIDSIAFGEKLNELSRAWADDSFTRGLYRLAAKEAPQPLTDAAEWIRTACVETRAVAVVSVQNAAMLESEWIDPLMNALSDRQIDALDLVIDEWHLNVDRGGLRRFWRRPLPIEQWRSQS